LSKGVKLVALTYALELGQITKKIMHITRYETKEHIDGFNIIDIDKASSLIINQEKNPPEKSSGHVGEVGRV
jgi:hypothetical protein